MKILYLECGMGAAGDMLTAALLELLPERESFIEKMNSLALPDVAVSEETVSRCGINGTRVVVKVGGSEEHSHDVHGEGYHHEHEHHSHDGADKHHDHHDHHHASMRDIEALINGLDVSEKVKKDALAVYGLIAEAESRAHGRPVEEIHFHEVGTMDAAADIVGVCLLIERISPDKIAASPVHVGCGQVKCAHGILPVPAPATAHILEGVPIYGGAVEGELCTPTGAALLKYFAGEFGDMPLMRIEKTGYGMGKKEFERANCVRAMLGESDEDAAEEICELKCNIDDMTGEEIGFAMERLFDGGALDVFTTPIGMKKCRPGVMLTCLCRPEQKSGLVRLIFRHTSTIGIRETRCGRYVLSRSEYERESGYGKIRVKTAEGYGVKREKAEFDDLARLAKENNVSLDDVKKA